MVNPERSVQRSSVRHTARRTESLAKIVQIPLHWGGGGFFMASQERVQVHTSRVWALFHGNFTQLLFPDRMIADKSNGFTRKSVGRWYVPWVRTEKHLPLTPFIQVDRDTDVVWDTVTVESSAGGGADALRVHRVAKRKARRFVKKVNEWLSSLGSGAKVAQPIR
jgi:hypothetical protein